MSHTPTPWDENFKFHHYSEILDMYTLDEDEFSRAQTCVNACEGMKDPAAEIAKLRELAVEVTILEKDGEVQAVGLKPVNVYEYTSKDTRIAQLEARVKELENPWINAKIRLPATNDLYITLGWNGILPYVTRFTDGEWFETEYDLEANEFTNVSKHITHWMPIINPPKPQQ